MKRFTIIYFLLLSFLGVNAQNDNFFKIRGTVIDCKLNHYVSFAHVINETSGFATATDTLGLFTIIGKTNDILKISEVGFKSKFLLISENSKIEIQNICLLEDTIVLQEVTVFPFKTFSEFKSKFLSLKIENNTYAIPGVTLKNPTTIHNLENEDYIKSIGFALKSPISYLYYNLNKREKSIRKFHKLENDKWNQYAIDQKYNPKIVEKITGLKSDETIKFMAWCNLSKEYLLTATDYEIIDKIKEKYKLYCEYIDN